MKYLLLVLLVATVSACVRVPISGSEPAHAYLPSELNRRSAELDGTVVTVRGYLVNEPEAYGIWDSKAAEEGRDSGRCVSLLYPKEMRQQIVRRNRQESYVTGAFRKNVTVDGGLFLGLCNFSGVTVTSIVDDGR